MASTRLLNFTQKMLLFCSLIFIFTSKTNCYPLKMTVPEDAEGREETRLANGTVIGKYKYKDTHGNPVHVKYYADEAGYGVELKSLKIEKPAESALMLTQLNMKMKTAEYPRKTNLKPNHEVSNSNIDYKYGIDANLREKSDDFENLVKEQSIFEKEIRNAPYNKISSKKKPEYEIFVEDDLKSPSKCGKKKVKVYNNIAYPKRKVRKTDTIDETLRYCNVY